MMVFLVSHWEWMRPLPGSFPIVKTKVSWWVNQSLRTLSSLGPYTHRQCTLTLLLCLGTADSGIIFYIFIIVFVFISEMYILSRVDLLEAEGLCHLFSGAQNRIQARPPRNVCKAGKCFSAFLGQDGKSSWANVPAQQPYFALASLMRVSGTIKWICLRHHYKSWREKAPFVKHRDRWWIAANSARRSPDYTAWFVEGLFPVFLRFILI